MSWVRFRDLDLKLKSNVVKIRFSTITDLSKVIECTEIHFIFTSYICRYLAYVFMALTLLPRSQPGQRTNLCELAIFPISLTGLFWQINSNVHTSYKGGCQDPYVDLNLTVTQWQRAKTDLVGDLWYWSWDRALITSVTDFTRLVVHYSLFCFKVILGVRTEMYMYP